MIILEQFCVKFIPNFICVGGYGSSNRLSPEVAKMASLTTSTYNGRLCQIRVSNTPGNLLELFFLLEILEIYKVSWKLCGSVGPFCQ